jgi:hypothetical protein
LTRVVNTMRVFVYLVRALLTVKRLEGIEADVGVVVCTGVAVGVGVGTGVGVGVGVVGVCVATGVTDADAVDAAEVPPAFVAVTVNVYAVPFVRPDTTHEPDAPEIVQVAPPGDASTVCDVAGHASNASATVTLTDPSPATTVGAAGTLGIGMGVTVADAGDAADVPPAFVAVTVNVYAVPFVRPDTSHEPNAPAMVQVAPPGDASTVCDVAGHTSKATLTDTRADPSPTTTPGAAGTLGLAIGVTASDAAEAADVPPAFVAVTVNVYAVPFVRPDTTHEPDAPVIVHVAPPGDASTVCDVAGHASSASVTDTLTAPSLMTTLGAAGALGRATGVTDADAGDAADVPPAFVAVAVNAYAVPLVRPDTTHEPNAPVIVHVALPGDASTVCDVAGHTSKASATVTLTDPSPMATLGAAGTLGTGIGVTEADAADAADMPPAFVAVAVNVYALPFVRPDTTHEPDAPVIVHVAPPGDASTVCDVAGHTSSASTTDTVAKPSPTTTPGAAGTLGTGIGVTEADAADAADVPPALLAVAVNV